MLFHFGRSQNGYVVTRFILISSTAESKTTSGYVVAPERSGQRRELVKTWTGLGKNLAWFPAVDSIDAYVTTNFSSLYMNFTFCI